MPGAPTRSRRLRRRGAPTGPVTDRSGPARDEDAPTPHGLRALNVTRRAQGSGLADLMMVDLVGDGPAYL